MAMDVKAFQEALDALEISKGISKETIVDALKDAMVRAYRKELGVDDADIRVNFDFDKGVIEMSYVRIVMNDELIEDDALQISPEEASRLAKELGLKKKTYKEGDEFIVEASLEDLRKATALSIKSIMKQKFAEAEKKILYETFKDRIGTMITGKVEKMDEYGCSVNIGKTSVYIPHKHMIGDERFANGDPIKVFISNVENGVGKAGTIQVSRANEGFLKALFFDEIREIYDGTIVIKGCARQAGERSKVAVYCPKDPTFDPAGPCIGPNGSRIQKIVGQLGNGNSKEKIDIITYSDNTSLYIMESLKPVHALGIKLDEENRKAVVIVKDDAFSVAIGRKGVNVRLASKLTGFSVDVKTESVALEENVEYVSYEEILDQEMSHREELIKAKTAEEMKEKKDKYNEILPGLPEGYVAPSDRVYEEEKNDFDEVFEQQEEDDDYNVSSLNNETVKEEVKPVEKEEKVEEIKEVVAPRKVKTTTSLDELEKAVEEEKQAKAKKNSKKSYKKSKKEEDEEESDSSSIIASGPRMAIYTEEELKEIEEEENSEEEYDEEEEIDYDDYDEYYDDDNR